jgi:hypothetical protein
MSVTAPDPVTKARRRHRPLEAALEIVQDHCLRNPVEQEGRVLLPVADGAVEVDSWVLGHVRRFFDGDGGAVPEMLAHGIAVMIKVAADRRRMQATQALPEKTRALFAAQAELMLDSALGMAIVRELQPAIDIAVKCGEMERAKALSRFQHELRGCIAGLKHMLDEVDRQRAEALSDNLTDQPRPDEAPSRRRAAPPTQNLTEMRRAIRHVRRAKQLARDALAQLPSRTECMFALLAILITVWLASVKLPAAFEPVTPVVGVEDLQASGLFVSVESRFPSLFITVDADAWNGLEEAEKLGRVRNLSGLVLTHGFTGALLRTAAGRPVAQWLGSRGAYLIPPEPGDAASIPPEPGDAESIPPAPPEPVVDAFVTQP